MQNDSKMAVLLVGLFVLSLFLGSATLYRHKRIPKSEKTGPHIGIVTLDGPIDMSGGGGFMGPSGAQAIIEEIQEMEKDKDVEALLIRVNSPGGTVGASQEIYNALIAFKKKRNIPVIASIGDVGASGAYWVSLGTDTIFANPGSMIGSIGVILANYDFSQLGDKYGIGMNTVKGGKYKDAMSSWRTMSDEERNLLQAMVDNVHTQFITLLKDRRSLSESQARFLSEGQIFSGEQALESGLIDKLGGQQEAIDYLKTLLEEPGDPIFINKSHRGVNELFKLWDLVGLAGQVGFLPNLSRANSLELR